MRRVPLKSSAVALAVWIGLGWWGPIADAAPPGFPASQVSANYGTDGKLAAVGDGPSLGQSIGSSVKDGWNKIEKAVSPEKPSTPADEISLQTDAKPGPDLFVAVARLYEQSGKLAEAATQYQKALKQRPDHLAALMGYARVKDRLGQPEEALRLYEQAAKTHPDQPGVFNNLGLYYARRGRLNEAAQTLSRAIQLAPRQPLYRNNIATVLVEMGNLRDAFSHLRAVQDEAVAYYNLGYLLSKKGRNQEAAQHFAIALRINPSLVQARAMLGRLQAAGPPGPPQAQMAARAPLAPPMPPQAAPPMPRQGPANWPGQPSAQPPVRMPAAQQFQTPATGDRSGVPIRVGSRPTGPRQLGPPAYSAEQRQPDVHTLPPAPPPRVQRQQPPAVSPADSGPPVPSNETMPPAEPSIPRRLPPVVDRSQPDAGRAPLPDEFGSPPPSATAPLPPDSSEGR